MILLYRERGLVRMQFDVAELCFWQQSDSRATLMARSYLPSKVFVAEKRSPRDKTGKILCLK